MKKNLPFLIACLIVLQGHAQLIAQLQLPQTGLFEKTQLWSMMLTNTTNADQDISIKLLFTDAATGEQVMSATTQSFILKPGLKYMNAYQLGPIQYNILSNAFQMDPSPTGLLPVGSFNACYFFMQGSSSDEKAMSECQDVVVSPLSPPQLIYPYNEASLTETTPLFSWLPPAPVTFYTKVNYDFSLVEVLPGQTPADAISQNVPLLSQRNIASTSIPYPANAPALQLDKFYAWKIVAKSLATPIGETDVWQFTLNQQQKKDSIRQAGLPYVKLQKTLESGYAIFVKELKIDYLNETADTAWDIAIYDLSTVQRKKMPIDFANVPLEPGQNLIKYTIEESAGFIDQHQYLMEVTNSRNEIWRLRFQYRKPSGE